MNTTFTKYELKKLEQALKAYNKETPGEGSLLLTKIQQARLPEVMQVPHFLDRVQFGMDWPFIKSVLRVPLLFVAIVAEDGTTARTLFEQLRRDLPGHKSVSVSQWKLTFSNGSTVQVFSALNPDSMRGMSPNVVIYVEAD